jgi:hypothetical protein
MPAHRADKPVYGDPLIWAVLRRTPAGEHLIKEKKPPPGAR